MSARSRGSQPVQMSEYPSAGAADDQSGEIEESTGPEPGYASAPYWINQAQWTLISVYTIGWMWPAWMGGHQLSLSTLIIMSAMVLFLSMCTTVCTSVFKWGEYPHLDDGSPQFTQEHYGPMIHYNFAAMIFALIGFAGYLLLWQKSSAADIDAFNDPATTVYPDVMNRSAQQIAGVYIYGWAVGTLFQIACLFECMDPKRSKASHELIARIVKKSGV